MDALLPPPEQTEEAEIQKGTNESPSAGKGREEKEEKEEKERGKEEWKEKKATNLWDKVDVLALRAILSDMTREHIAKSCYAKVHLDVWKETCGGAEFMEIGMLSYLEGGHGTRMADGKEGCSQAGVRVHGGTRGGIPQAVERGAGGGDRGAGATRISTIPQSGVHGAEERGEMAQDGRLQDDQRSTGLRTLSDGLPRGGADQRPIT
jgi:hypothetical protein